MFSKFNFFLIGLILGGEIGVYTLEFSVGAKNHAAMPLIVAVFGKDQAKIEPLVVQLIKDLEFSKQFKVKLVKLHDDILKKESLQNLAKNNAPLAIFINTIADQTANFEWRLYDLLDLKMLLGKKVTYQGDYTHAAHMIANKIWQQLMGCPGYFNSVIVACKKNKENKKNYQYIYVFHPTNGTSDKKMVVDAHTFSFAPRWHPKKRLLYYSQNTPKNVRLMAIDHYGRKSIVTNFDGLNLTPAISPKGQIVVSLSSGGCEKLYRYEFDPVHKLNKFIAITDGRMHAISPSFIDEDKLVFCAIDAVYKLPRIAIMNLSQKTATFLTGRAFCVSPVYCKPKNKIAYCKRVHGVQQIFCYDLKNGEHQQITNSGGDKDDCSWSPCGNYLVFTEDRGKESRIALWNMLNSTQSYLSPKGEAWSFPAWSPCYEDGLFS
jgi:Tol biopolymer transport system component